MHFRFNPRWDHKYQLFLYKYDYKINYWLSITYLYFEDFSYSANRFLTLVFFIKQSWFKGWSRSLMASYSPRKFPEIVPNSAETKHYGIPRNSAAFRDTEFRIIPRNFWQFRIAYGMYGSKKNIRNSVLTEFRGHPTRSVRTIRLILTHVGFIF
jgi:hypothetical protein